MRTIIIGDVHGCLFELKDLLDLVEYNKSEDKLILLGDYIDRGDYSFEVLEFIQELKNNSKNVILLRGNHEVNFIKNRNIIDELIWKLGGKYATVLSFNKHKKDLTYFNEWIEDNTVLYYEDKLFQCCHSSIKNEDIKNNSEFILTTSRKTSWTNKYSGRLTIAGHIGVDEPSYFPGRKMKVKSLPYDKELELPDKGMILIDTKCSHGGKLTAMIINDNKYVLKYINKKER